MLAACSSEPDTPNAAFPAGPAQPPMPTASPQPLPEASPDPGPGPSPSVAATPPAPGRTLALEGIGDLRIGQAIPTGSSWKERGAQIPGGCRTVSSPDFPGAYAIVEHGKVQRITISHPSDVTLVEGVGAGASEADVKKWFAGFRAEPHKYQAAPAKYLTAPNAGSGGPALRFEIGQDGRVSMIHVGAMPVLAYVEGCA